MIAVAHRRAFLSGLVSLPLIGGAVELIGSPSGVAAEATDQLMFEYAQWLSWERVAAYRQIHIARDCGWSSWADHEAGSLECHAAHAVAVHLHEGDGAPRNIDTRLRSHAHRWHRSAPLASTRAALVLSAVGCDWRGPYV